MRIAVAMVALCLTIPCTTHAQESPVDVGRVAWLGGCWRQVNGTRVVEEEWMAPRAGMLLGMGRTVRDDTILVEFEHLQITARDGRLVYHAEPSGQTPADFEGRVVSDTLVMFENPSHDFPQRITYRKRGADSLLARIEGTHGGRLRGVEFPYARVVCANGR